ncbi:hypothetical protein PR048_019238 [Dryococelus australis]|uniref:Selenocysteine lyase n=1 Tax=Dryococelus australis TaxID=614101 RepID=A0ABQ9H2X7_9NEOP|nr:hypothetical protein PR048_019238 [Dryococelus australis]
MQAVFGEEGVQFNCSSVSRLPNTSSVSFIGSDLAGHVILSNCQELMASVGAACHSQNKPSDILIASGVPLNVARSTVRLSVGRTTTKADVDMAVSALKKVVDQLIARPLGA